MSAQRAIALIGAMAMLAFSAREVTRRGVGPAKTVSSRSGLSPRSAEDALLILGEARRVLPKGARVVFVDVERLDRHATAYAVATGQLPEQSVLPYEALASAEYLVELHGRGIVRLR